jgi:sugar lactone lactonase YvrE
MRRWSIPTALIAVAAALLLLGGRPASRGEVHVATPVRTYDLDGDAGLRMPSAVAVGPAGQVFVADGVNDRVVVFDGDGGFVRDIEQVAGRGLARPTALATSRDGRLWIADSGNRRVAVVPPEEPEYVVPLDPAWSATVDITGLAVSLDGGALWLVDNDNHRVLRGELDAGAWTVLGRPGAESGDLHHPFQVALGHDGAAFVSDVLNGRVQGFSAEGRPIGPLGSFGVTAGHLYRPSGVAVVGDTVWVADATLGVIQIFDLDGGLVDVLRGGDGDTLRLDHPMGVVVVDDRLLVVEMTSNRVREFALSWRSGKPRAALAPRVGDDDIGVAECTVCHLEAMPDLARATGGALIAPPRDRRDDPYVSRDRSCLSCHDGTVLDSREKVWRPPGHPLGPLTDGMKAPPDLPLPGGEIACRTCHTAHSAGGSAEQRQDALRLCENRDSRQLCAACHADRVVEGTEDAPRHREVACNECHPSHESAGANRRELVKVGDPHGCLYCHGEGAAHEPISAHPGSLGHVLIDPDRTTDPPLEGCPSCHGTHDSTPQDRALCRTCHVEQDQELTESGHGHATCLDCHPAHELPPESDEDTPELNPLSRRCLRCHSESVDVDGMEDAPRVTDYEHPAPVFLPDGTRWERLGDMTLFDAAGRQVEAQENGDLTCGSCHRTHGPDREHPGTKRRRPNMPVACATCHGEAALADYLYFHLPERRKPVLK